MNTKRAMAVVGLVLAGVCAGAWAGSTQDDAFPIGRVVNYSFTLVNTGDRVLSNAQFWVYAPVKQTSYQQCKVLEATGVYDVDSDGRGNQVMHFALAPMMPYATQTITLSSYLGFRREPLAEGTSDAGDLAAEPLVEIADKDFRSRAPTFADGTPQERARAIYEWTARHIATRTYMKADHGALYALRTGEGDCTECACLFVALCRLQGIPARVMAGYRSAQGGVLDPDAFHNWAEYYDGRTWRLADVDGGVFDAEASKYVAVRVLGGGRSPVDPYTRFRGEGEGLRVTMNRP